MSLHVQETFINQTEGYIYGETPVYETYAETIGELFRAMQREYGRCVSKMYVGQADDAKAIGWVFERRERYEDTGEVYVREVWVSVHTAPDTVTCTPHYLELAA